MTGRSSNGRVAPVAVVWSLALVAGAAFWAAVGVTASIAWSGGTGDRLLVAGVLAGLSQVAVLALWLVASHEVEGRADDRSPVVAGPGARVPRPRSGVGVPV